MNPARTFASHAIRLSHKLIRRDRLTKYNCVNNLSFPFDFAAVSFLPKGIGRFLVDYMGYNKNKIFIGFEIKMG